MEKAMKYEDALREWGARKIEAQYKVKIDRETVKVSMEFEEGYNCCGGYDEGCYCSMATSGSASVDITGQALADVVTGKRSRKTFTASVSHYDWDFATILGEIVNASGGSVSN
jgi:hypothetical protein